MRRGSVRVEERDDVDRLLQVGYGRLALGGFEVELVLLDRDREPAGQEGQRPASSRYLMAVGWDATAGRPVRPPGTCG